MSPLHAIDLLKC